MDPKYGELYEEWEIAIVWKLVHRFQEERGSLKREDPEGLVWDCLAHWHRMRGRYDPSRGASQQTFMGKVVQNKLKSLDRSMRTDKRKVNYLAVSLDEPLGDDESPATLADELDETAGVCERRDTVSRIALRLDLERAVTSLTSRQRTICHRLRDGYSVMELSELLKTPRATIYDEIKRIRSSFAKRGFKNHLG